MGLLMSELDKESFLNPLASFHGTPNLPHMMFDANLQEFSRRVGMICALENGGKISPREAYKEIKALWKTLKASKENILGNDDTHH
jgi:hypothetical protein